MIVTNYTREELKTELKPFGGKSYSGEQIFQWVHKKLEFDLDKMTDLKKEFREELKNNIKIHTIELIKSHESNENNTTKYLFQLQDNNFIESVIINESKRITLCVSTQVGCKLKCVFCATGKLGFMRNLETNEIVSQYLLVQGKIAQKITNIVFMGMGEPFLNFDNTIKSAEIFSDQKGASIAHRRITISTAGIIPEINRFIKDKYKFRLAVSLNSAIDKSRNMLMPINKKYNLEMLSNSLKDYHKISRKQLTFEYVLIEDVNDSEKDAEAVINFVKNIKSKINLIPYNPIDNNFKKISEEKLMQFYYMLKNKGLVVNIRNSQGYDINAACGQLTAGYIK
ncbi:23S rRNA (adenine(2503)-C(2))-methyltransferase RlmN [candidate division KSB1 bacterium]